MNAQKKTLIAKRAFPVLFLEDDKPLARALIRSLRPPLEGVHAENLAAAREHFDQGHVFAAVVDIGLANGESGFTFIRYARERRPNLHVAVLTARSDPATVLAIAEHDAVFLPKPNADLSLHKRLLMWAAETGQPWAHTLDAWAARYRLTPTERLILEQSVRGASHEEIRAALGCTNATLERHISNLLGKTGDDSLLKASNRLLREAMG